MKVKIKTLTPVHIGTGKKLGTLDFLVDNYRISYDKLFEMIAEEKQDEFYQWLDQNPQISVNEIINKFHINKKAIIDKCGIYKFSDSFQRDLNEGIKDPHNKLYIPGSSIKGSLRTALMYKVLLLNSKSKFLNSHLDYLIKEAARLEGNKGKIKNLLKSADDKLEEEVFNCGVLKKDGNDTKTVFDDQKYDLMKLVQISDTSSVSTHEFGEISELQVYALNKVPPHKTFKTNTESIKDNVELEFDVSVDIEFLKRAKEELKNPTSNFGKKYFIGIEQKLKDLFDIDIINDSEFIEENIVNNLIKSWNNFGNAVSEVEKKWVDSVKNKPGVNLSKLNKLYSIKDKFKIGFATGFSGMTILPLLLNNDTLKQKAETFYKAVKIGIHRSTTPLKINEFPFTRKYSNNQKIYDGFGWIQFVNNKNDYVSTQAESKLENINLERPANTVIAEITDINSKPAKVKILEGEYSDSITILPGVNLSGLGLSKGSKVYVKLFFDKKKLQKAEYKGKVE